jgi:hypothetical protein
MVPITDMDGVVCNEGTKCAYNYSIMQINVSLQNTSVALGYATVIFVFESPRYADQ